MVRDPMSLTAFSLCSGTGFFRYSPIGTI